MNVDCDIKSGCLRVIGCCAYGNKLDWVSSDFQLNKKARGSMISIYRQQLQLLFLAITLLKSVNTLRSWKSLSYHQQPYQRHFVCPAGNKVYISEQVKNFVEFLCVHDVCIQRKLLARFCSTDLILSGDGRCDFLSQNPW